MSRTICLLFRYYANYIELIKNYQNIVNQCIHNLDRAKLANRAIFICKSFAFLSIMAQS